MNVPLVLAALWRLRLLVAAGLLVATVLAGGTYYRVVIGHGGLGIEYRQSQTYSSTATVFVTQKGFPWGRTYLLSTTPGDGAPPTTLGDPSRFASLAILYTELANSDQVREIMRQSGPVPESLEAVTVVPPVDAAPLPLIRLAVTSDSPENAVSAAQRYTSAFQASLRRQQAAAGIPPDQRVLLSVTQRASEAQVASGRSKVMPMMVFVTVVFAFVGLALLLDNIRMRIPVPRVDPLRGPAADG
jgi:hypothetical protein